MPVIYEPTGRAREYSELACNLYSGCSHACTYCYCPAVRRQSLEKWSSDPQPRKDILRLVHKEAMKADSAMKDKDLLFSFMSDPYQSDRAASFTRLALLSVEGAGFSSVNILTKAGARAVKDFDLFERNSGWKFGSTVIFLSESLREKWEPGAPSIESRIAAIEEAHSRGIFTWVSIEPVVDTEEAKAVARRLLPVVDLWKVGKLNHNKAVASTIDWPTFLTDMREILNGKQVIWKHDLLKAGQP